VEPFALDKRTDVEFFDFESLKGLVAKLFELSGLEPSDAAVAASVLVEADLTGVWSHGVARVPMYRERLRRGAAIAKPKIATEQVSPCVALIDGDNGLGLVVAPRAMDKAIDLALSNGLGLVGVRRSGHFGAAAHYLRQATSRRCIALSFTTASPAIAPWGAAQPFFGTSPFGFSAPTTDGRTFLIDMAMSKVARGKLKFAAQRGDAIAEGYAVNSQGAPTTDGKDAFYGAMLPFGEHKGAALSWMMDVFAGVFTGAAFGGTAGNPFEDMDRPQGTGHVFIAIRNDLFIPEETFAQRMAELDRRVKALPTAPGVDRIFAPGELEATRAELNKKRGVPLTQDVVQNLRNEAERSGVAWPF
jgi:L-2-hydroxycarboxylate dehydrogenase (NAD+)